MACIRKWIPAVLFSAALVACGGGGSEGAALSADGGMATALRAQDSTSRGGEDEKAYSALVVFGDSLSDVGSYRTPGVAYFGGGKYTVNGPDAANWTEILAGRLGVPAPCPAQTGLESLGPLASLAAPVENHPGCTSYAQGGSRVTDPIGLSNKALYLNFGDPSGLVGQLTVPVMAQIQTHLDLMPGQQFSGQELVAVLAGANDLFIQLGTLSATIAAGGSADAAAAAALGAMAQAGAELAGAVTQRIVGRGARRVVVVNLPDVGKTPFARAQTAQTQALMTAMAQAFNAQLAAGLSGGRKTLLVDAFSASQDQVERPARYGLSNVTAPACDLAHMLFPSALVCSTATVIGGDVSRYEFSDAVHPTPYGYRLLARLVMRRMDERGWLEVDDRGH